MEIRSVNMAAILLGSLLVFSSQGLVSGQEAAASGTEPESDLNPVKAIDPNNVNEARPGLPSPYDKFIGLELIFSKGQVDWTEQYRQTAVDVDPSGYDSKADSALALGIKIADGAMAVKAENVEGLNDCADQMKKLAGNLGVSDGEMKRADTVRDLANKENWGRVFLELGMLQSDMMQAMRSGDLGAYRPLIIAGGWVQGAHYTTTLVTENYTPEVSNYLREPLVVELIRKNLDEELAPEVRNSEKVGILYDKLGQIHDIIDIEQEGTISEGDVKALHKTVSELVDLLARP